MTEALRVVRRLSGAQRKQLREVAGLSLRELAADVGCTHGSIVGWENGAKPHGAIGEAYAQTLACWALEFFYAREAVCA